MVFAPVMPAEEYPFLFYNKFSFNFVLLPWKYLFIVRHKSENTDKENKYNIWQK